MHSPIRGRFFACQNGSRCLTQGAPEKQGGDMILTQWRARRTNRTLIDQLHGKIVAASRRPSHYLDLEVADTFEGRFEMVTLYSGLVIRRLTRLPGIGLELAQELTDSVFRHFEIALREIGIGDVAIPKRLKRMGEAFYGRNKAYDEGLAAAASDRLVRALARNVYGVEDLAFAPMAVRLARYVRAVADALERTPIEAFAAGNVEFPELEQDLAKSGAGHG
jgi:cytochrome b pre-mRNA-processing protein 3